MSGRAHAVVVLLVLLVAALGKEEPMLVDIDSRDSWAFLNTKFAHLVLVNDMDLCSDDVRGTGRETELLVKKCDERYNAQMVKALMTNAEWRFARINYTTRGSEGPFFITNPKYHRVDPKTMNQQDTQCYLSQYFLLLYGPEETVPPYYLVFDHASRKPTLLSLDDNPFDLSQILAGKAKTMRRSGGKVLKNE